jgi:hypothetical protein
MKTTVCASVTVGLLCAFTCARASNPDHPATPTAPAAPAAQPASAAPGVQLIALARIPFDARDASGLTGEIGFMPADRLGGMGSAIEWLGPGDASGAAFIMLADRGPEDGARDYACRVHELEMALPASVGAGGAGAADSPVQLAWRVRATRMLTGPAGAFVGQSARFSRTDPVRSLRLDPEGVRALPAPAGAAGYDLLISDEYGPTLRVFSRQGAQLRTLPVPTSFAVGRASPSGDDEDGFNSTGRAANRGFEGVALSPDGATITACLQSPLLQDGGKQGLFVRWLQLGTDGARARQIVYPLRDSNYVLSEVLAIDEHRFLVIERDGEGAKKAGFKAVMLADARGATDVSGHAALPRRSLAGTGVTPVRTRVLIDLLEDRFGLAGADFPAKVEGLCWGPTLPDGRSTLWVATDNDFRDGQDSQVWVFALTARALE